MTFVAYCTHCEWRRLQWDSKLGQPRGVGPCVHAAQRFDLNLKSAFIVAVASPGSAFLCLFLCFCRRAGVP